MHAKAKNKGIVFRIFLIFLAVLLFAGGTLFAALYKPHAAELDADAFVDGITHNYTDIEILPRAFAAGTIISLDNTWVEVIKAPANSAQSFSRTEGGEWILYEGKEAEFKIHNCGYDESLQLFDVDITIDNVKNFSYGDNQKIRFRVYLGKNSHDGKNTYYPLIDFNLCADEASAHLRMKYLKAGTNNLANVHYNSSLFSDIDSLPNPGQEDNYKNEVMQGKEYVRFKTSRSAAYYMKTGDGDVGEIFGAGTTYLYNERGNHRTSLITKDKETSATILQKLDVGSDRYFEIDYGGHGCGIGWSFVSPWLFETLAPHKTVSESLVHEGESFYYTITQVIPNNAFGDDLKFLGDDYYTKYTFFAIKDTIPRGLTVSGDITFSMSRKSNASEWFTVSNSGNAYTFKATTSALENNDFYNQLLTIKIPVTFAKGAGKNASFPFLNKASLLYTNKIESTTKVSNEVQTDAEYSLLINFGVDERWTGTASAGIQTKPRTDVTQCGGEMPDGMYMYRRSGTLAAGSSFHTSLSFKIDKGCRVERVELNGKQVPLSNLSYDRSTGIYTYNIDRTNINSDITESLYVFTKACYADLVVSKTVGTEGNVSGTVYSPAGATYGVYNNQSCTDLIQKLTINPNGRSDTIRLYWDDTSNESRVVYVKELTSPPPSTGVEWTLDDTVYRMELKHPDPPTKNADAPLFTVDSHDNAAEFGHLHIRKITMSSGASVTENNSLYTLEGAKFSVEAKDGSYSTTLTSGKNGWTDTVRLPAGWYTVTETKAPKGYSLPTIASHDVFVSKDNTEAAPAEFQFADRPCTDPFVIDFDKEWSKR